MKTNSATIAPRWAMGAGYTVIAVIGLVVILLPRRWESIFTTGIWLVGGLILLLGYRLTRNRRRRNTDD